MPWPTSDDYETEQLRDRIDDEYEKLVEDAMYAYECQQCGTGSDPDDHQRTTPHWCNSCDTVTTHERREDK